jgi:hypothetical protein
MENIEDDDYILEMSSYVVPTHIMTMVLAIYGKEGSIPHFHFYRGTKVPKGGKGGGCLRFDKPTYFQHKTHLDTLNSNEKRRLKKFLKSEHPNEKINMSMWEYFINIWNESNPDFQINRHIPVQEY